MFILILINSKVINNKRDYFKSLRVIKVWLKIKEFSGLKMTDFVGDLGYPDLEVVIASEILALSQVIQRLLFSLLLQFDETQAV